VVCVTVNMMYVIGVICGATLRCRELRARPALYGLPAQGSESERPVSVLHTQGVSVCYGCI
jgi:hypothetical protein